MEEWGIYEEYADSVLSWVKKKISNPEIAHELVQEVFLKAWRFQSSYNAQYPLKAWLRKITEHTLYDYWRSKAGRCESPFVETLYELEHSPTPEDWIFSKEGTAWVLSELEKLTPGQREAVSLKLFHDMDYRNMAEILQTTRSSAKNLVFRGLHRLRTLAKS